MLREALKIIILEDDETDVELIQHQLNKGNYNCQYSVMLSRNAYEQALDNFKPDLILSDNELPQFTASEALQILLRRKQHIPFILVTGTVSEEFAAGIIKAGADDYLLKDHLTRLPVAIDAALYKKKAEKAKDEALAALKASEEKYRDIVENISDILCTHDLYGKVYSVNEAAKNQLGYEIPDMLTMRIQDILSPRGREEFGTYIEFIKAHGFYKGLMQVQTKAGDTRIWEVNNSLKTSGTAIPLVRGFARDVTERIIAERKLAASEKRFRALIENSNEAIALLDKSLKVFYRSPATAGITGWTDEELADKDATINIHPDDVACFKDRLNEALKKSGIAVPFQARYRRSTGNYIWTAGTFTNMLNIDGVNAVVTNFSNNTKRKEAEDKVMASEKRFRNSLDIMLEGVQIIGFDWRYIYVNDALAKHAKYEKEELLGYTVMEKFPGIENTDLFKVCQQCFDERIAIHLETEFEFPDKSTGWFEFNFQPVPEGIFILSVDITERKNAEAQLNEERDKLVILSDTVPGVMYTFSQRSDGNFQFSYVSNSVTEVFGLQKQQLLADANAFFKGIHPDDRQQAADGIVHAIKCNNDWSAEFRYLHPDKGIIWLEGKSKALKGKDGGMYWHGITNDITERKIGEQKIIKANRLYAFISQVNQMILRATDEQMLFKEACNIAVEFGKFKLVWIGMLEGARQQLIPVRYAGDEQGYLAAIKKDKEQKWPEASRTMHAAIKDGKRIVCNDIETDVSMAPWKEEAVTRGFKSLLSLPIKKYGKILGAFSFLSAEPNFFDDEETLLLEEATRDISFALEVFDKEKMRQTAEAAELETRRRYQTLAEVAPVGIFHTDTAGNTTYINPNCCNISGLTVSEALDGKWLSAVHLDDRNKLVSKLRSVVPGEEVTLPEFRFVRADGSIAWVMGQAVSEKDSNGSFIGYVGTLTDITEIKKAESELARLNRRLEAILHAIPDLMFEVGADGRIYNYHSHSNDLLAMPPEAFLGKTFTEVLPPDVAATCIESIEEAAVKGFSIGRQYALQLSGGEYWFELSIAPMEKTDEQAGHFICLSRNITMKKLSEKALQESEESYRILVENAPEALVVVDVAQQKFVQVSESALTFFKMDREQLLSKGPKDVSPEYQPGGRLSSEMAMEKMIAALRGMKQTFEWTHLNSLGELILSEVRLVKLPSDKNMLVRGSITDITERKKAAEMIVANEKKFRKLVENGNDAFVILSPEGKGKYISSSVERLLGYSEAEAYELDLFSLTHPADLPEVAREFKKALQNPGIPIAGHTSRLLHKNGSWRWFEDTMTNLLDDPDIGGIVDNFRDVTERKEKEEEIKTSEEKRRLIMNAALDAIICIDTKGVITFWNPQAEKIFGWQEEEVMGKVLSDIIIPEPYRKMHDAGMENYLKTGQGPALNVLLELNAVNRHKVSFPVELTVLPIKQGGEEFFCAFIRDISERKKAAQAILLSNDRYNMVARATNDSIWELNIATKEIARIGDGFKTLFGYDNQTGNSADTGFASLVHPDDLAMVKASMEEAFANPDTVYWGQEYRFLKANGEYAHVYDRGYIIRDAEGNAIQMIGATQDISKLKENELNLLLLNQHLQSQAKELADSNAELEQFAYVASHDLQEPLRMVTSFLTLFEKKYSSSVDENGRRYINFAVDGAMRMRQIIVDILEFSTIGRVKGDTEAVDLNKLISETMQLFQTEIEAKKAVIKTGELPVLMAQEAPLRQVFHNLIGNALKYAADNRPPVIAITATAGPDYWQFAVADNGIGISEEYFDKIFVIFQRLHNQSKFSGTGIGLGITKKIIENFGGKIWLESKPGKGSTFFFTIKIR
ncbi:PAS domain S-box protein [Ferruginibacter paludis]|uniref:PAS domain S-box protein n=1 Tax=Ferruginibacter paludis TaxID=1310417 RepID=UPI0025B3D60D|nr:PAS domain S-box protein [Ferruginibacter paludis]MDN3656043.1 PAS domain S-box protein [Ferruginibacter paludis]